MKACTVHALWAWAILNLDQQPKDIENRNLWPMAFKGDMLITVSANVSAKTWANVEQALRKVVGAQALIPSRAEIVETKALLGHARGVVHAGLAGDNGLRPQSRWAIQGLVGVPLSQPRHIKPFPVIGALGCWELVVCPSCGMGRQRPAAARDEAKCAGCGTMVKADAWREPELIVA